MDATNNTINLEKLTEFLVRAKINTYAGDAKEISPQRPGFKEFEFIEGDFEYRDSYVGLYFAPGQEIVRFKGKPIWAMAYSGGVEKNLIGNYDFCEEIFSFLKQALKKVQKERPFRGPNNLKEGDFEYVDKTEGDISLFNGVERIFFKGKEVFKQHYIGGLIIHK
ncbi:MAG: hypothetical protein KAS30_02775 [Candidatus Diapherotrites archaeon]|nr:hypothetical protein [Candidatus Diapherotrites archaeon]